VLCQSMRLAKRATSVAVGFLRRRRFVLRKRLGPALRPGVDVLPQVKAAEALRPRLPPQAAQRRPVRMRLIERHGAAVVQATLHQVADFRIPVRDSGIFSVCQPVAIHDQPRGDCVGKRIGPAGRSLKHAPPTRIAACPSASSCDCDCVVAEAFVELAWDAGIELDLLAVAVKRRVVANSLLFWLGFRHGDFPLAVSRARPAFSTANGSCRRTVEECFT